MHAATSGRTPGLSPIGFGAAQLGNLYRETTDEESTAAVDAAWDGGIRYFDTAPHYGLGLSEQRLGRALAGRPRQEYVISTKVGRVLDRTPGRAYSMDPEGFVVPAAWTRRWDFTHDGIMRSLDDSLTRLGLDSVDIVYLHDPDDHWAQASTAGIETLLRLRDEGVVRAVGVGMNQAAMIAEFIRRCDVDVVMLAGRYTLLEQGAADDLLPLALERGVDIVAAGAFNSGLLSGRRPGADATFDYSPAPAALQRKAHELADICESHGVELADAAVAFPARHPAIRSVVLGMRTASQVAENLARASRSLPDALWRDLALAGVRT